MPKKIPYEENHKVINGVLKKLCNRCNNWFNCKDEFFYKNKCSPDGLFPYCKECNIKASIQEYNENKEKGKEQRRNWYIKNKNIVDAKSKNWRKNNKEHKKEYQLEYQRNNTDKIKQYQINRQHKNHNITEEEWENCKNYFNYNCAYCGLPYEAHYVLFKGKMIFSDFHKEHYNDDGANDLSNCIPSCKSCNSQKWKHNFEDWYNKNNPIFNQDRLNKINKWLSGDYLIYSERRNK